MSSERRLDVQSVRRAFPALQLQNDYVFADNAGGSQVLKSVVDRIGEYMIHSNVQMANYDLAHKAADLVANGTAAAALLANTKPENIMFGSSATQLFETLSRMMEATVLARREKEASDAWPAESEIILTSTDHEANRGAWLRLASRLDLKIINWRPSVVKSEACDPTNIRLDIENGLLPLLSSKTRLVAFTASSNVLGSHFLEEDFVTISRAILEKTQGKAYIAVDAVAFAPHRRIRPEQWGVDFCVWSWYKLLGPHLGCAYLSPRSRREDGQGILTKLNHHFLHDIEGSMYPFQPSSIQYELVAGIAAVIEYLIQVGSSEGGDKMKDGGKQERIRFEKALDDTLQSQKIDQAYSLFALHEAKLSQTMLSFLEAPEQRNRGIRLVGETLSQLLLDEKRNISSRAPTVAFICLGKESQALHSAMVSEARLGAQVGHMYAYDLVKNDLGLDVKDGVVRVSFVHYNTLEEVKIVCRAIDEGLKKV